MAFAETGKLKKLWLLVTAFVFVFLLSNYSLDKPVISTWMLISCLVQFGLLWFFAYRKPGTKFLIVYLTLTCTAFVSESLLGIAQFLVGNPPIHLLKLALKMAVLGYWAYLGLKVYKENTMLQAQHFVRSKEYKAAEEHMLEANSITQLNASFREIFNKTSPTKSQALIVAYEQARKKFYT